MLTILLTISATVVWRDVTGVSAGQRLEKQHEKWRDESSGQRTADTGTSSHWSQHSSAGAATEHGSGIVVVIITEYKCLVSCCDGSPVSKSCSASIGF